LLISGIFGAIFGSIAAVKINPSLLKKIFGSLLFIMGLYEIFAKQK